MPMAQAWHNERFPRWRQKGDRRWRTDDHLYAGDAPEAGRLELQHDLLKLSMHRHLLAPVADPQRILDVACGIGLWGLEILREYPEAQLTALDIDHVLLKHFLQRPRARQYRDVLSRFSFVQADATKRLPLEAETFDVTHSRIPDTFLSEENWPRHIQELRRVTKPDGWVELLASDYFRTERPSDLLDLLLDAEIRLCQAVHVAPTGGPGLERYLREAGITHAHRRTHVIGGTAKQRQLLARDIKAIIVGTRDLMLKFGILSEAAFDEAIQHFEEETQRVGFLMNFYRIWFRPQDQVSDLG